LTFDEVYKLIEVVLAIFTIPLHQTSKIVR
jgi:hypothetical protein